MINAFTRRVSGYLVLLAGNLPGLAAQEPLSLGKAMARADSAGWTNRVAAATTALQRAEQDHTLRGILPTLRGEAGWARTTDPLAAFGYTLRQRGVTPASFDPTALNYPAPTSNVGAGLVAELPLFNPDIWLGRSVAGQAVRAAESSERWTRERGRLDVVRLYYGGVLSNEQVRALEAGHAAALAHVSRARSLFTQGLVTRSDVLIAEVAAGELETQLLAARSDAGLAVRRLAVVLGTPGDTSLALPSTLPPRARLAALPHDSVAGRADVDAAHSAQEAATLDVKRAGSQLLPRLNSFGRWDWNAASDLLDAKPAWTIGVMASWSFFSGGAELTDRKAARAREASAQAQAEAVSARASLEAAERGSERDVALASLDIADRAVAQATEAHRIVARKYEGGLAPVTELLEAAAIETRTRLGRAAALYRAIVATAGWQLATGRDLMQLTALDSAPGN
jgi:outer membrane protein TolC